MITKISKGSTFAGLGRYLYAVGKGHEAHVDPRAIAGDGVLIDDRRGWRPWSEDLQWCASRRPEIKKPVWHCSLRAAPEDPTLPDARWAQIAAAHVTAMGLDGWPWVAVRHGDDHVHLVVCRVDAAGRLWRDSHDYARAMRSARAIEREQGLAVVDADRPAGRLATTTASERSRTDRLNRRTGRAVDPERVRLAELMHTAQAAAAGQGLAAWHRELERAGVLWQAHVTSSGRVSGYRVSLHGWTDRDGETVWLKASQVDRGLGWQKLRAALGADTAGADRMPATAAQLAAQAFPTATAAEVERAARLATGRPATGRATAVTGPGAVPRPREHGDRDLDRGGSGR